MGLGRVQACVGSVFIKQGEFVECSRFSGIVFVIEGGKKGLISMTMAGRSQMTR